jgi:hypothetical protein
VSRHPTLRDLGASVQQVDSNLAQQDRDLWALFSVLLARADGRIELTADDVADAPRLDIIVTHRRHRGTVTITAEPTPPGREPRVHRVDELG